MFRNRWQTIKWNLRFTNSENMPSMDEANRNKLFKIWSLLNHLFPLYWQLTATAKCAVYRQKNDTV